MFFAEDILKFRQGRLYLPWILGHIESKVERKKILGPNFASSPSLSIRDLIQAILSGIPISSEHFSLRLCSILIYGVHELHILKVERLLKDARRFQSPKPSLIDNTLNPAGTTCDNAAVIPPCPFQDEGGVLPSTRAIMDQDLNQEEAENAEVRVNALFNAEAVDITLKEDFTTIRSWAGGISSHTEEEDGFGIPGGTGEAQVRMVVCLKRGKI